MTRQGMVYAHTGDVAPVRPNLNRVNCFRNVLDALVIKSTQIDLLQFETQFTKAEYLLVRKKTLSILAELSRLMEFICKGSDKEVLELLQTEKAETDNKAINPESLKIYRDITSFVKHKLLEKAYLLKKATFNSSNTDEVIALLSSCLRIVPGYKNISEEYIFDEANFKHSKLYQKMLEEAVSVRRMYGKYRLKIRRLNDSDLTVDERLRSLGNILATIVGDRLFNKLRPRDRLLFRQLQKGILNWFQQSPRKADHGQHLWEDVQGAAHFLMEINNRSVLFEGDQECVRFLAEALKQTGDSDLLDATMVQEADNLFGRHLDLDLLLHRAAEIRVSDFKTAFLPLWEKFK